MISKNLLTDEAKNIMETVKTFCEREFKDTLKWDAEQYMPFELWAKMGEIGLTGVMLDSELGGLGMICFWLLLLWRKWRYIHLLLA